MKPPVAGRLFETSRPETYNPPAIDIALPNLSDPTGNSLVADLTLRETTMRLKPATDDDPPHEQRRSQTHHKQSGTLPAGGPANPSIDALLEAHRFPTPKRNEDGPDLPAPEVAQP